MLPAALVLALGGCYFDPAAWGVDGGPEPAFGTLPCDSLYGGRVVDGACELCNQWYTCAPELPGQQWEPQWCSARRFQHVMWVGAECIECASVCESDPCVTCADECAGACA